VEKKNCAQARDWTIGRDTQAVARGEREAAGPATLAKLPRRTRLRKDVTVVSQAGLM